MANQSRAELAELRKSHFKEKTQYLMNTLYMITNDMTKILGHHLSISIFLQAVITRRCRKDFSARKNTFLTTLYKNSVILQTRSFFRSVTFLWPPVHVCWLAGPLASVGLSKGGKLHFNAPIGELVYFLDDRCRRVRTGWNWRSCCLLRRKHRRPRRRSCRRHGKHE